MPLQIRWSVHAQLSCAHAAFVVATEGRCIDGKTEQGLIRPVSDINTRLISESIDVASFWDHYQSESIRQRSDDAAARHALLTAGCSELQIDQTGKAISRLLAECRSIFQSRYPKLDQQLPLRAGPIKDRWETWGHALLRHVERQIWNDKTPADWWPAKIDGLLIQPIRGGDGDFDSTADAFWMEAILSDVVPQVPEVLRVLWLVTQLAIDSHIRSRSGDVWLTRAWKLASVPLVLRAACELELIAADPENPPIQLAIETWQLAESTGAEKIQHWWKQAVANETPLPVALQALSGMLQTRSAPSSPPDQS